MLRIIIMFYIVLFKLKIGIVTLFLSYASLCYAGDFRKGKFGMNLEEIKALEPDFKHDAAAQLLYGRVELMGLKALATYVFNENEVFTAASYSIEKKDKNPQVWINRFMSLESHLTTKYGTPDEKQIMSWFNTLYKDKKEQWGLAIQKRHLSILSRWETKGKRVILHIEGSYQRRKYMHLTIHYSRLQQIPWR